MTLLPKLIDCLNLERIDDNVFIGDTLFIGSPNVYGGHVLAQSVMAAHKLTDPEKHLHSMHGYFLSPGDNSMKITYHVEKIKEGRSFDAVRVTAKQKDRVIFILAASFHKPETSIEHQDSMPNVPDAESLRPFPQIMEELVNETQIELKGMFSHESPIMVHPVEYFNPFKPGKKPALSHIWFKPNGDFIQNPVLNAALLAYASDFNLLVTALRPHDISFFNTPMQIASLDHAMYFHRWPLDADWHLYVVDSPISMSARAFCRGKIFNKSGDLVCSVGQEGLIRVFS